MRRPATVLVLAALVGCVSMSQNVYRYRVEPPEVDYAGMKVQAGWHEISAGTLLREHIVGVRFLLTNKTARTIVQATARPVLVYASKVYTPLTALELSRWTESKGDPRKAREYLGMKMLDAATAVLPGLPQECYLVFMMSPDQAVNADVRIVDLCVDVDSIGNCVRKENPVFRIVREESSVGSATGPPLPPGT